MPKTVEPGPASRALCRAARALNMPGYEVDRVVGASEGVVLSAEIIARVAEMGAHTSKPIAPDITGKRLSSV